MSFASLQQPWICAGRGIIREILGNTYSNLHSRPDSSAPHRSGQIEPIFELCGVDAQIEGETILRDVDWIVTRGEHWGVVGRNGAGKSTLLALVSGQRWPAPGRGMRRYRFGTRWHRDAVEARRRITLVGPELQDYYTQLGWNFSATAVVLTGIHRTEIPRRVATAAERAKAMRLLEALDAQDLADREFLTLSHGEQRRVLIARALAFEPEILLLDEPASGLDSRSRSELERTIALAAQRTTIIASAHAEGQLPSVVCRVAEIESGAVTTRERLVPQTVAANASPAGSKLHAATTPATLDPLIEVGNANVWLGDRHVLKNIDWRLGRGEHWLIRGNNGAGKSTFLRLLHGQLRPALGGTIGWPGLGSPRNVWALRRQIAWVAPELQATYRYPTTTAACIASGFTSSIGQTRTLTPAERDRCEQLLAEFGLEAWRHRRLTQLSYGQKRRVLLARTLATRPRVLLLDEPWEGLDSETVDLVCGCLRAAMAMGTQIVCASHVGDMGLGLDHELVLVDGAIQRRDT
jgi:molybdate transport system ATP-binding protein